MPRLLLPLWVRSFSGQEEGGHVSLALSPWWTWRTSVYVSTHLSTRPYLWHREDCHREPPYLPGDAIRSVVPAASVLCRLSQILRNLITQYLPHPTFASGLLPILKPTPCLPGSLVLLRWTHPSSLSSSHLTLSGIPPGISPH